MPHASISDAILANSNNYSQLGTESDFQKFFGFWDFANDCPTLHSPLNLIPSKGSGTYLNQPVSHTEVHQRRDSNGNKIDNSTGQLAQTIAAFAQVCQGYAETISLNENDLDERGNRRIILTKVGDSVAEDVTLLIPFCSGNGKGAGHWSLLKVTATNGLITNIEISNSMGHPGYKSGTVILDSNSIHNKQHDKDNNVVILREAINGLSQDNHLSSNLKLTSVYRDEQQDGYSCMDHTILEITREGVKPRRKNGQEIKTPDGKPLYDDKRCKKDGDILRAATVDVIRHRIDLAVKAGYMKPYKSVKKDNDSNSTINRTRGFFIRALSISKNIGLGVLKFIKNNIKPLVLVPIAITAFMFIPFYGAIALASVLALIMLLPSSLSADLYIQASSMLDKCFAPFNKLFNLGSKKSSPDQSVKKEQVNKEELKQDISEKADKSIAEPGSVRNPIRHSNVKPSSITLPESRPSSPVQESNKDPFSMPLPGSRSSSPVEPYNVQLPAPRPSS